MFVHAHGLIQHDAYDILLFTMTFDARPVVLEESVIPGIYLGFYHSQSGLMVTAHPCMGLVNLGPGTIVDAKTTSACVGQSFPEPV